MNRYRVELRAVPDTPEEEQRARAQHRVLTPQTVIYPSILAISYNKAARQAIDREKIIRKLYAHLDTKSPRASVRLFEPPILFEGNDSTKPTTSCILHGDFLKGKSNMRTSKQENQKRIQAQRERDRAHGTHNAERSKRNRPAIPSNLRRRAFAKKMEQEKGKRY